MNRFYLTFFLFAFLPGIISAANIDSLVTELGKRNGADKFPLFEKITGALMDQGEYMDAITFADQWLTMAISENHMNQEAKALVKLSKINMFVSVEKAIGYAKRAASVASEHQLHEPHVRALNILGQLHFPGDLETCKGYMEDALNVLEHVEIPSEKSLTLNILGLVYLYQSEYQQALKYLNGSLVLKRQLGHKNQEAVLLNSIGVIYRKWGEFKTAIEYYQQALQINEELDDKMNTARVLSNIGNIYYDYGIDYEKALEYYNQGLQLFIELNDSAQVADIYNNIGHVYKELGNEYNAEEVINKGLTIARKINYKQGIATSLQNLMEINLMHENYQLAIKNLEEAKNIYAETEDQLNLAIVYLDLGKIYNKKGSYTNALNNLSKGLAIAREINIRNDIYKFYEELSDVYEKLGDYNESLVYFKKYSVLKDSVFRDDYLHEISELQTKYETEKKEKEIELQKVEIARQDLEMKRGRIILYSVTIGFILILVFSVLLYKQYKDKQKANVLLQKQNKEIKEQRDQIYEQKQHITASIRYASRIQTAILPPYRMFYEALPEYFILFRPRDIVSGDFYWITQKGNKTVVAAADCTGHGVPGAFMSMLGIAFLNEIVNNTESVTAAEILNQLRDNVVKSLHQTGIDNDNQDGMDIALCVVDQDNQKIQFAGAFNPMYLIRDGELEVFKGDKMPISIYQNQKESFRNHEIQLKKKDTVYIFSDGYADQFGGEKRKKFMIRRFKKLLLDIHHQPMGDQKKLLDNTFEEWKGDHDQVDDVLVMGVRF
jgi:serine phosphatase RsbU (regulator of sigma subunit)/uncharacterized protein HemY